MSKLEIYINDLQYSDLDSLMEIESTAYGEHHWSKDSFANELNNKVAKYYAVKNNKAELVGYMGVWNIVDEAHITTIAVREDYRRMHVGEALIAKMLEDCYNNYVKYITLEVRVGNVPAVKLYEKFGFKSLGVRKGYYQDNGEDALIMWTENIFHDNFKEAFKNIKANLENYLIIK